MLLHLPISSVVCGRIVSALFVGELLSVDKRNGMLHVYAQTRHVPCTVHAHMCVTCLTQTYISSSYIL